VCKLAYVTAVGMSGPPKGTSESPCIQKIISLRSGRNLRLWQDLGTPLRNSCLLWEYLRKKKLSVLFHKVISGVPPEPNRSGQTYVSQNVSIVFRGALRISATTIGTFHRYRWNLLPSAGTQHPPCPGRERRCLDPSLGCRATIKFALQSRIFAGSTVW
jgi:hypothetical protein